MRYKTQCLSDKKKNQTLPSEAAKSVFSRYHETDKYDLEAKRHEIRLTHTKRTKQQT